MVFSSPLFLFFYLPAVLLVYYMTPLRWRNAVLLVFNLIFYGWGEPVYILIMFLSIAIDYTHGMLVEKAKRRGRDGRARAAVCSSVLFNLALLFFFKYWDFLAESLAAVGLDFMPRLGLSLPIGISFYTFQTMSYTIDVYRGDAPIQKNPLDTALYVALFPQLVAGPIVRYTTVMEEIAHREETLSEFAAGATRFCFGLSKKMVLANSMGQIADGVFGQTAANLDPGLAWVGALAYTFQIYFDFSSYSDMAIGLGHMFGFHFLENFNYPYISRSVTEFWRRWHISLGTWFREYLYIPLGGNRVSKPRLFFNLLVVWAATGIWHGASWNFLLWGLYFGVLLMLEKLFLKRWIDRWPACFQHAYTLLLVAVSWAIFALEDFGQLGAYLAVMFGLAGRSLTDGAFFYYLRSYLPVLVLACLASTPLARRLWHRAPARAVQAALPVLLLAGLLLSTAYLVDATYNPFLYFRF